MIPPEMFVVAIRTTIFEPAFAVRGPLIKSLRFGLVDTTAAVCLPEANSPQTKRASAARTTTFFIFPSRASIYERRSGLRHRGQSYFLVSWEHAEPTEAVLRRRSSALSDLDLPPPPMCTMLLAQR